MSQQSGELKGLAEMLDALPERVVRYNSKILENFIKVFANPDLIKKEATIVPSNSRLVNTKKAS